MKKLLGLLILAGCGGYEEGEFRVQSNNLAPSNTNMYCPSSFSYNTATRLCESNKDAIGPFTSKMVEVCLRNGGGAEACKETKWARKFAASIRGTGYCMLGSSFSGGLCVDSKNAYGPFPKYMVDECYRGSKSAACYGMRWEVNYARSIKAKIDTFPLFGPTFYDYSTGQRQFGGCRDNCSRKHAGCDLLEAKGTPIYAVTSGKIVDFYYFYDGTYALVVDHGKFVVRYGEVDKTLAKNISIGSTVYPSQHIASIGRMYSGSSMLHFEMYSGKATGQLTTKSPPFYRRKDLLNPTNYLKAWPYPIK